MMTIHPIRNDQDHERALARIEALMDLDPAEGSAEYDELDVLSVLVEDYERRAFPLRFPTPAEAVRFRMEQAGLKQRDLVPIFGSAGKVSEVLNGKRTMSLAMMRRAHAMLGIPAEVLLQQPGAEFPTTADRADRAHSPA